jgi:uncharacterized protein with NAD-binding domain and iron-sulfur cluster
MSAAWDLTTVAGVPADQPACDVTVFVMGGRLGGKTASSRNHARGDRIEEHGLHLWLGYYENAFRMLRTCFEELKGLRTDNLELREHLDKRPFNDWDWLSAFERANLVALADYSSGDWVPWIAKFPEYVPLSENGVTGIYQTPDGSTIPGVHIVKDHARAYPGEAPVVLRGQDCPDGEDLCLEQPNVSFFLTHALRELQVFVESLELRIGQLDVATSAALPTENADELLSQLTNLNPVARADDINVLSLDLPRALRLIRVTFLVPAIQALATVARVVEGPVPYVRDHVVGLLDRFIDSLRERVEESVARDIPARRIWELIDLLAANIRGLVVAGLEATDNFASLDEYNYEDWLRLNRVSERTLKNPILRGAYDLGLAYVNGDPRDPQIAAGQALNAACRFFFMYKGALFWRMKAGMGDVLFAPMYLALRSRGVKFRFFHRLDDIDLGADGRTITRLKFWRQVKLKITDPDAATNYQPLVDVPGQRMSGWPSHPHDDQFDYDDATRAQYRRALEGEDEQTNVNFESIWCNWKYGAEVFATVGKGYRDPTSVGDFDDVIVTVPIAALGRVSQQLSHARNDAGLKWKAMLNGIGTVATQSAQLWVNRKTRDLGWTRGQVNLSAFVHPFDTWADLSQLVAVENQPDARGVHYFCSVLPEEYVPAVGADPQQVAAALKNAKEVVTENTKRFLSEWIFHFWPDAVERYPNVFRWEYLVDPDRRHGAERLNAQHIVANVDPSERYTQSLPGTTKYRIRPDQTGFHPLFIAGDWTECGLNLGCVEAAVISGRLASSGIRGYPDARLIPGYVHSGGRVAVR